MEDKRPEFETLVQIIFHNVLLLEYTDAIPPLEHYKMFVSDIVNITNRLQEVIKDAHRYGATYEDFVVYLSYEIRVPITSINAYVKLIQLTYGQQLNQDQTEILQIIEQSTLKLEELWKHDFQIIRNQQQKRNILDDEP